MSTATPNFFAVLTDDSAPAVGSGAVHLASSPKVAAGTSSKKGDVNPKADPAKARKKPVGPPSNDRTFRENKNGGHSANRSVPVKEGPPGHISRRHERTDRMPRSDKRDTPKRTRAGWGDAQEPVDESVADEAAISDEAGVVATEPETPRLTLGQYQQQQREIADSLSTRSRKPTSSAPPAPRPETAVPEPRKKLNPRVPKETVTLEIDYSERRNNTERSRSTAPRGRGGRGGRGGRRPEPKRAGVNLDALPKLA